ncbi:elongation factor G [candidate division KSB1 bacterium]|nr:elongation factor G [candidate division KSB1 bacterium]MBL7095697.1 elongation factor G [candidate division KSB1 bacterium]
MKEYTIDKIRNIGLIGHGDSGKTTLAEAMLFASGESNRFGSVDDGTTTSDYSSDEIERKISITTSLLHVDWKNTKINILDTPGYFDFLGEVKSGFRAADIAVMLLNGVSGVEVGTDLGWEILQDYDKPRLFYINHLNREHANFDKVLEDARETFGNAVVAVNFPVNEGEGFNSVIDVLKMKKVTFSGDSGKYTLEDIPADLQDKAENLRTEFIEKVAECDDEILEKYFEEGELSEDDIVKGIKTGLVSKLIFPVLCGSATKNVGTQLLMDFITSYCPSPADMSAFTAEEDGKEVELKAEGNGEFAGFVFKTLSELHVGELSLIRVFSGSVKTGDDVLNTTRDGSEKIGQIYTLNGKERKEIGILNAGDIGALVKLKETHTGDTLSSKKKKLKFKPLEFFTPVYEIAITPKSKGDEDKISTGLHTLNEIDPSFSITIDPELHQTVIAGKGEVHLTVILKRLKERFGVEVERKKPKIAYRETITGKADEKYRHKKQSGGAGQFAEVWMRIEPQPRGDGFVFENKVVGGSISSTFIPSVEKGVKQVIIDGAIAGYKIVDVKATVYDGKEHPVDSKDIAFQIAGREVFKMAIKKAKPILLEPIYNVEVKCPEENMGDIMGDISTRRGKIQGMESAGRFQVVKAQIPLAELNDYSTSLRSMTQGRATYSREFSHYDPLQKDVEAKVVAESKAEKEK